MLSYSELLKPSVVTHCTVLPQAFQAGADREDLLVVVRGGSLLQCFRGLGGELTWVCELSLQGTVQQLARVGSSGLALSFAAAKLVLLEWNGDTLSFDTKSLHLYEKHVSRGEPVHKLVVDDAHDLLGLWVRPDLVSVVHFGDFPETLADLVGPSKLDGAKSTVRLGGELVSDARVADIVDVAFLPFLAEPSLALLAWSLPSWAGLVSTDGAETKVLVYLPMLGNRALRVTKLPYDVSRIVPVTGVENRLMLLLASRTLYFLDEASDVTAIDANFDFANCAVAQLRPTPFFFVVLRSGDALVVDIAAGSVARHYSQWLTGMPTTVVVHNNLVVVGSRDGNAKIAVWSGGLPPTAPSEPAGELASLADLYTDQTPPRAAPVSLDVVHEIVNYGSLSAVATIDGGLACAANRGVLLVDRELALVEHRRAVLDREIEPGSFWIPSSQKPLLLSSYIEIEEHKDASKRQKLDEKFVTEMAEVFPSSKESTVALPRGLAKDQTTLAVYESEKSLWVVQKQSISVFDAKSWRVLRTTTIDPCDFADISSSRVMTYTSATGRCTLYDPETLERLFYVDKQDTATISSTMLVSSQGPLLRMQPFDGEAVYYNASNLDSFCLPTEPAEPTEPSSEAPGSGPAYLSLYALRFHNTDYVGVQIDRVFVVYEPLGGRLVKRFTLPFAVNQAPVFLSNIEALILPGKKTHVLVKHRAAGFTYHRLALGDDRLIDIVPVRGREFAWLDDRDTLHFSELGKADLAHGLPLRFVPVDATVKAVAFHEEWNAVVIGANVETDFVPAAEAADAAHEGEPAEQMGEAGDEVVDEIAGDAGDAGAADEAPAPTYVGQIHVLPLATLKPRLAAKLDEALLSMCMIDYDEVGCPQLLAVGTAGLTVESAETNGHVELYRFLGSDVKLYASELVRGAVSSLATTMRYLAAAHGNQVHIYNVHAHSKLDPIAFFGTDVYVQDLKAARNILGLGERLRAPRLVNFSTTPHRVDPLSSADADQLNTTFAVEFVSSAARGDLSLVRAGPHCLQVLQYDPENLDSNGGQRLVPLADFHTGRQITALCAAQIYNTSDIVAYGVAADGALVTVRPLNEEMYRTFHILGQHLGERVSGEAGLNPKAYRSPEGRSKMLDLDFAQRFWALSLDQQAACGRILGFQGLGRAQRALSVEGRDLLKL